MDKNKKDKRVEILRKRNMELSQQIQELESLLKDTQEKLEASEYQKVQKLMDEFNEIIVVLKEKEQEYNELLYEMKQMREFMNTVEFRDWWIKKAKKDFMRNNKN